MKRLLLLITLLTTQYLAFAYGGDFYLFGMQDPPGIQQPETEISIDLFPNPLTEGRLNIRSNKQILSVQVLNITGKMVFSQEYSPGNNNLTIDLANLERGLYLVRITSDKNIVHTEKVMVK